MFFASGESSAWKGKGGVVEGSEGWELGRVRQPRLPLTPGLGGRWGGYVQRLFQGMGNMLVKWDRRWFVLTPGMSKLRYYRSAQDEEG